MSEPGTQEQPGRFRVIKAAAEYATDKVKNCVVVDGNDLDSIDGFDIMTFATNNDALENNADDEAGDDNYLISFEGGMTQKFLDQDSVFATIRGLKEQKEGSGE